MECHQNNMRLFLYYMVVNVLNILQSHFLSQKNTTNNNKRVGGKAVQLTRNLNPKPPRLFVFVLDSLM
jgi:membrane protein insertase Oxa1/YidC/SpoIIIJ